jgi:hypothetical protein
MKAIIGTLWKLGISAFMICAVILMFFTMFTWGQVETAFGWFGDGISNVVTELSNIPD